MHQAGFKSLRELSFGPDRRTSAVRLRHVLEGIRKVVTAQFLRYALMGSCAALVQLVLLALFVEIVGMPSLMASTSALAISVLVNYSLQHRVTFRSKTKHAVAGPRFIVLTLGTLAANAFLFGTLSMVLPYLISQVITLGAIFPLNYYLNKTITFGA